jgi:hypothetical protein
MIDLCITHHKTEILLEKLLVELHKDKDLLKSICKIYIYDSDSGNNFKLWVRRNINYYRIERMFLRENNGYAHACNYMASKGNSDIIGFIHGDVLLNVNDLKNIQHIFDTNPGIHILGPKILTNDDKIYYAGTFGENFNPTFRGMGEYDPKNLKYKDRKLAINVSSAGYFIRRNVWNVLTNHPKYKRIYPNSIGAFLETPHFFEEVWCSYFARFLGYNVVYDGSITFKHTVRSSSFVPPDDSKSVEKMFYDTSKQIFLYTYDKVGLKI